MNTHLVNTLHETLATCYAPSDAYIEAFNGCARILRERLYGVAKVDPVDACNRALNLFLADERQRRLQASR